MGEWRESRLGELVSVKGGKRLPNGKSLVDYTTSHPYIRTRDINGHKIAVNELLYVPEDVFPSIKSYIVDKEDVIISIVGTIGLCAVVPDALDQASLTENCAKLVNIDEEKLDRNFLFYYLVSPIGQDEIEQRNVGSTQPKLPLYNIKDIPIPVPSVPEQKAIASVLSSLDDKIDLLHRQNKTLEAMAETLFRQWFVEEAQEDWDEGKIEDLFVLQRGFDLPAQNRTDGPHPIYTASGYSGGHVEYKVKGPGVTTGRSGLLGKVFFVLEDFWPLNTSLYVKEFKRGTPLFSYFFLKTLDLGSYNAGSAVPTLNRNHVHEEKAVMPPPGLIARFEEIACPLYKKIKQNEMQVNSLEKLRDTLLPKLMSGEVRVSA